MKNVSLPTILVYALSISALGAVFMGYPVTASIICTVTFFIGAGEYKKYTGPLQVGALYTIAAVNAFAIESMRMGFPFIGLAVMLAALTLDMRSSLIKYLAYSRFIWIEPLLAFITLTFYTIGNLYYGIGWQGWVLPIPMIIPAPLIVIGVLKAGQGFKKHIQMGYQAEIGKPAPEFSLPDQDGNTVNLSDFMGSRGVLLIFVRGDWCPACHIMLRTYEKEREKFQQKNIVVMAIGPDPVGVNQDMVKRLGLDYKVLSDEDLAACGRYGLQITGSKDGNYSEGSPLPASFLIDKSGIVRYSSRPDRVGEFLNPSTIFPILESISA